MSRIWRLCTITRQLYITFLCITGLRVVDIELLSYKQKGEREGPYYIPMSQRMSAVLSEESMFASTSHECSTVSPAAIRHHELRLDVRRSPSRKWSRHPYPGISSSGPTRTVAPRSL